MSAVKVDLAALGFALAVVMVMALTPKTNKQEQHN